MTSVTRGTWLEGCLTAVLEIGTGPVGETPLRDPHGQIIGYTQWWPGRTVLLDAGKEPRVRGERRLLSLTPAWSLHPVNGPGGELRMKAAAALFTHSFVYRQGGVQYHIEGARLDQHFLVRSAQRIAVAEITRLTYTLAPGRYEVRRMEGPLEMMTLLAITQIVAALVRPPDTSSIPL